MAAEVLVWNQKDVSMSQGGQAGDVAMFVGRPWEKGQKMKGEEQRNQGTQLWVEAIRQKGVCIG